MRAAKLLRDPGLIARGLIVSALITVVSWVILAASYDGAPWSAYFILVWPFVACAFAWFWAKEMSRPQHVCPNPRIRARLADLPPGRNLIFDFHAQDLYLVGKYGHRGAVEWVEILQTTDGLVIEFSMPPSPGAWRA